MTGLDTPEINAITLAVAEMARSVRFYVDLGFAVTYGGSDAAFTSLKIGTNFVNLQLVDHAPGTGWGRVIFHVNSPDAIHQLGTDQGYEPHALPADAPWGERYFHISDPDGHELSFARRL